MKLGRVRRIIRRRTRRKFTVAYQRNGNKYERRKIRNTTVILQRNNQPISSRTGVCWSGNSFAFCGTRRFIRPSDRQRILSGSAESNPHLHPRQHEYRPHPCIPFLCHLLWYCPPNYTQAKNVLYLLQNFDYNFKISSHNFLQSLSHRSEYSQHHLRSHTIWIYVLLRGMPKFYIHTKQHVMF